MPSFDGFVADLVARPTAGAERRIAGGGERPVITNGQTVFAVVENGRARLVRRYRRPPPLLHPAVAASTAAAMASCAIS
jgi:hypothetical protein